MKRFLLIGLLGMLPLPPSVASADPLVKLPLGLVRGVQEDGFYSFRNIPYAEPPLGNRRFKPPKTLNTSWNGELDATGTIKACVQFSKFATYAGDEDCLYLHIVTPAVVCDKRFPVRVHIHGGAFMIGSADEPDPSILVKRGMIVVTMGYRLGPLGFLSTGDGTIPGNNGLRDQRLVIKWVKENIRHFCGDDNKIFLAGVSAGAASAHMHMLHKSTEDYVNGVIAHNGVATCPWALETHPQKTFKKFAEQIDCPTDPETLVTCLQSKSVDELKQATCALQYYKDNPFTVFPPVVEPDSVEDPFFTEHPEEIMKQGKVANVTFLVAYAEREGTVNAATFLRLNENGTAEINILNERWLELAPYLLFFQNTNNQDEQRQYATFLKEKYLGNKEFSEENYRLLENMYTEILFTDDIKRTIELHRKHSPGKVHVSLYKYPHNFTLGNILSGRTDVSFGADHVADTILTIPMKFLKPSKLTDKEIKLSHMLEDMFLDWANKGVVSFGGEELPAVEGQLVLKEDCYTIENKEGEFPLGCRGYE